MSNETLLPPLTSDASKEPAQTSSDSTPQNTEDAPISTPSAKSRQEQINEVAALLRGENEPESGSNEPSGAADGAQTPSDPSSEATEPKAAPDGPLTKPKTLSELSESAGVTDKDLYAMTVNTGDGETATLSELKDVFVSRETSMQEIAQKTQDLNERESAFTQEQQLWSQVGDQFENFTTPEQRAEMKQRIDDKLHTERQALARAAPELNNKQAYEGFAADVLKLTAQFGFEAHEVNIADHRQLLLLRGYLKTLKVIEDLKAFKPKPLKGKSSQTQGRKDAPSRSATLTARARKGGRQDQINAVAQLLKEG